MASFVLYAFWLIFISLHQGLDAKHADINKRSSVYKRLLKLADQSTNDCCKFPAISINKRYKVLLKAVGSINNCGVRPSPIVKRVVGGEEAEPYSWPWMVIMYAGKNQTQYCAGSIVDPYWIVTSALCFDAIPKLSDWLFVAAEHDFTVDEGYEQVLQAERYFVHPQFVPGNDDMPGDYDIALVRLKTPIKFNTRIRAVCLPDRTTFFPPGKMCTVIGWGDTEFGGNRSPVLREANVPLVSPEVCNQEDFFNGIINNRNLCAGYSQGGVDACYNDGGGPLMCQDDNGKWILFGLVSWGFECARPTKPGVYAAVKELMPFVQKTMTEIPDKARAGR